MPLPLKIRKNLRDTEAKRDDNLAKIKGILGEAYTLVCDFDAMYAALGEGDSYAEQMGTVVHDWRLNGLIENFEKIIKGSGYEKANPLFVGEFNKYVTSRKIVFMVIPERPADYDSYTEDGYCLTRIVDGELRIMCTKDNVASNVDSTGKYLVNALGKCASASGAMSVKLQNNLKANEAKRDAHLARLKKATGMDWTLEVEDMVTANSKVDDGYKDRMGEIVYDSYLDNLANAVEKLCKDDMSKEAFVESTAGGKVTFKMVENGANDNSKWSDNRYSQITLGNGGLTLQIEYGCFWSNVGQVGHHLEEML